MKTPVYLDNHSTTAVDPRVLDAMLPYFCEQFGNAGSISHSFGSQAREAVDRARTQVAKAIGGQDREIVFTSGATESNNLAIRGVADALGKKGRHLISVATEHPAVLDPLERLSRRGFDVTLLPVHSNTHPQVGQLDLQQLRDSIRDDTILVSVMWANNETGVIQPLSEIAELCQSRGVILHCDATQAVGKIPVDLNSTGVDLLSFSAHKFYGPKGVGGLFVRRRSPQVRLVPLLDGGGQEGGRRSGTLNVPGIVGLGHAMELAILEMSPDAANARQLRDRLYHNLSSQIPDCPLNGPSLEADQGLARLPGNLNLAFRFVDGESLMLSMGDLAVSSGSACTAARSEPSHVLRALGIAEDQVRASLRFGIGRFNTKDEIDFAVQTLIAAVKRLRALSSMA